MGHIVDFPSTARTYVSLYFFSSYVYETDLSCGTRIGARETKWKRYVTTTTGLWRQGRRGRRGIYESAADKVGGGKEGE